MRSTSVILLSLLLSLGLAAAEYQYDFHDEAQRTYDRILSLQLDRAGEDINLLRRTEPRNLAADHLESYLDFFRLYLSGNEQLDAELEARFEDRLSRIERGDPDSPWTNYVLAENRLHRSLIHLRFQRHLAAFRELNKANKLLRDNVSDHPDFVYNYKDLGLLHAAVGSIPPQYKWGVSFFSSLSGTIAEGRREMALAVNADRKKFPLFHTEIAVLSAMMEIHFVDNTEGGYRQLKRLGLSPERNSLHAFLLASVAERSGRNDEAIRILDAAPRGGERADFPYLDFLAGQTRLQRLEPASRLYFQSFLLRYEGTQFREEALQKIAWSYLLEGDAKSYFATLERINGQNGSGGDQNATREAASGKLPNVDILRLRLLFDGSYGPRARAQMNAIDVNKLTEDQRLEYYYRSGRVMELVNEPDLALELHRTTIDLGRDHPAYYACKSALQSGLIEEKRGNKTAAVTHFEDCLSIDPTEYKTGLHLQAKAGLNRVR